MSTHALITVGTGATAAATRTQIGSDLTLPAGGPWTIFGLWGQVVKSTTVPDEGTGGQLIIESASGDVTPDPSPGKWPLIGSPVTESANSSIHAMALNIWPVNFEASGKAVIKLYYLNQLAITTGSPCQAGIIFGDTIPEPFRAPFCDSVYSAFAATTETLLGTVTLAEKATRIRGILCELNKGDAATTAEYMIGYCRLASDDVPMPPSQYPAALAFNAGDGTIEGESATPRCDFIPVDIPVAGGARIQIYGKTPNAVTGNVEMRVYLAYE